MEETRVFNIKVYVEGLRMDRASGPCDVICHRRAFQRETLVREGQRIAKQQKWNEYRPALVAPPNQLLATVDSVANANSKTDESEIFISYQDI